MALRQEPIAQEAAGREPAGDATAGAGSVPARRQDSRLRLGLLVGAVGSFVAVLAWQVVALIGTVSATPAAAVFCGPTLLHTMSEPPETQLTRDYAVIRILLYDTQDHFDRLRRLYVGSLRASPAKDRNAWLLARTRTSEPPRLFKTAVTTEAGFGSLRHEALRLDRTRGKDLARRIEAALTEHDRAALETAFYDMFALLTDELLSSIRERLGDPATAIRLFGHVRRYYAVGLEARLSLTSPARSRAASLALDAMAQALGAPGTAPNAGWFERERRAFVANVAQNATAEP